MKKRILLVVAIAALVVAFGLVACASSSGSSSAGASSAQSGATSTSASSAQSSTASASSASQSASAAASSEAASPVVDGSAYGYAGDDPLEYAIYKYLAEEIGGLFEDADVCTPVVRVVHVDYSNPDEVVEAGDFWVYKYNIEGDTLVLASGGNFPGVMHVAKEGDGYVVKSFDRVEEGAGFQESAERLFGEYFEDFHAVHSDYDMRKEDRKVAASDYVNLNGLAVTKFQDLGQDPVELYK